MAGISRWHGVTLYLVFCSVVFSWGDILFGLDTGSFGSLQALPSWLSEFGQRQPNGTYVLNTNRQSVMNSVVWIGKLFGTIIFEPILERVGYKVSIYIVCVIQAVGIIIELTAKGWQQFSIGRVFAYCAVGIVENIVPSYEAEIAPANLRGLFAGSIQVIVILGNIWGSGMSRAYANETGRVGWLVPVAIQLVPVILLAILTPFCVESPRWLILKGRREQAIKNLDRLRPEEDVLSGVTIAEVDAFEQAIEEGRGVQEGRWIDLFRGTYFRRTMIICWIFFFQETTGQQFFNSYGPTFYKQMGLGAKSFTYTTVGQLVGLIGVVITISITDRVGRRPIAIIGTFLTIIFNFVSGSLGAKANKTPTQVNTVIASLMLVNGAAKFGVGSLAFLIGSELGGVFMRKKTLAAGTAWDVVSAFIVTFCTPYIQNPPGVALGPRVGYVFGGVSVFAFFFCIFFVPELRGRSLEEVDELFERRLWAWQFAKAETYGVGARIAQMEMGARNIESKAEVAAVEEADHSRGQGHAAL